MNWRRTLTSIPGLAGLSARERSRAFSEDGVVAFRDRRFWVQTILSVGVLVGGGAAVMMLPWSYVARLAVLVVFLVLVSDVWFRLFGRAFRRQWEPRNSMME